MATAKVRRVKNVSINQDPQLIVAEVTFASGLATVTAAELGCRNILGFAGGMWGATTGLGYSINTTTALVAGIGVTSLALELVDDASALVDAKTATVLFWTRA